MNDDVKKHSEEVALFRFGVIGDLVRLPPGAKGLYERLKEKADIDYRIPGSPRVRVAPETIRDWLKAYRRGGLDALKPKVRADQGQSHALPREVSDLLLAIKDDKRDLSVQLVIREALATGKVPDGLPLAPSTVHRLLSRAGLMAKEPNAPTSKDHRRFAFEKAGDLWMSDVMHGPAVTVGGKKRKAYLIAFIDDATRVVPYAAFALSESTAAFLPVPAPPRERRSRGLSLRCPVARASGRLDRGRAGRGALGVTLAGNACASRDAYSSSQSRVVPKAPEHGCVGAALRRMGAS